MDALVLETQKWLNSTFGGVNGWVRIEEDGQTGWNTVYALTRALQHELGISSLSSNFGPTTIASFNEQIGSMKAGGLYSQNLLKIVSGALWCKGYTGCSFSSDLIYNQLSDSIATIRTNLGLNGSSIDVKLMKSLLTMDAYTIPIGSDGNKSIREVEQFLNSTFSHRKNFWLVPCDGISSRAVITGMLYGVQYDLGMDDDTANGYFGPGTQAGLKNNILSLGAHDKEKHFVKLFQSALRLNRYESPLTGVFDEETLEELRQFQSFMELNTSGKCDYNTWCSLLISSGNPELPTKGFDSSHQFTEEQIQKAKNDGYTHIGRYTVGASKFISANELRALKQHGMALFPIHQRFNTSTANMTRSNGQKDGLEALQRCRVLGLPANSTVFFAVDFDPLGPEISGPVLEYFKGVNDSLHSVDTWSFNAGVYGTRNVCQNVIDNNLASTAFVAGMSWGWSGNMGYRMPDRWSYNQIAGDSLDCNETSIPIDKVVVSRNAAAVSLDSITPPPTSDIRDIAPQTGFEGVFQWITEAEVLCEQIMGTIYYRQAADVILSYLRRPRYLDSIILWQVYLPASSPYQDAAEKIFSALEQAHPVCYEPTQFREVDHWAASTLSYVRWGLPLTSNTYSLGDLGGWLLDIITLWKEYKQAEDANGNLEEWLERHLGYPDVSSAMSYSDVIADIDAYLIAKTFANRVRLSDALREIYQLSPEERVKRFYSERFSNAPKAIEETLNHFSVTGARELTDRGLVVLISIFFTDGMFMPASDVSICARVFAERLASGLKY